MIGRYIIVSVIGLLAAMQSTAQITVDTLRNSFGQDSVIHHIVIIHDTIYMDPVLKMKNELSDEDVIYTKGIGRYDRGIANFRFIPQGKWIGGLTASYVDFDSDDSRLLFSLIEGFDSHLRMMSIKPFIGYAVKDNLIIGARLGYSHAVGQLDNLSIQIDDIDVSLSNMRYTEDLYSFALFHRSYVGLDTNRRFGLFNETALAYNTGTSRFSREFQEQPRITDTTIHELHLGINPGIAVFIMQNVSAEFSFGVAGLKFRYEKQRNNQGETGSRHKSGADFKINLFNINIGITFCL